MFHFLKYRSQGVLTTSLYQNDCSIDGLKINVLENKLYYLQDNALYVVDWTMNTTDSAEMIYQTKAKLRNLIVNREFISFIEEGSGLVLMETKLQTEFCKVSEIKEHFTFYGDDVVYNEGLNVFKKKIVGEETAEHCFTTPYPITQIIEDEDTIIVQMESTDFKKATKLVWNKENETLELKGSTWRIFTKKGTRYYTEEHLKIANDVDTPSKEAPAFYKAFNITPLCEYTHEGNVMICYEKSGCYHIAKGKDINEVYAVLDSKNKPQWFAYLGDLIVYFSNNEIHFVRVANCNFYPSALEAQELIEERNKMIRARLKPSSNLGFNQPIIDIQSPSHMFELHLISEDYVRFTLNTIPLPSIICNFAHLDILTGYDISLITISKIVEKMELEYPNTEFEWKVIPSHAMKENMALVYCSEVSSEFKPWKEKEYL